MRKKDPKVSIIITTHNGSDCIENALISVLMQSWKFMEIIIVDDNGTGTKEQQKTASVVKPYIDKCQIKYIVHEKNKNGSHARNTGAYYSTGEWLAFLDDDDLFLPDKIEKQIKYIYHNNVDMVVCGGFYIKRNGTGYISRLCEEKEILKQYLTEKILFNTSTILIKKAVFIELNGFDVSFKRHQDWEFITRVLTDYKVGFVSNPLIIKYSVGRNVASNARLAEEYIEHFFDIVGKKIYDYSNKQYFSIKNYQYIRVAKLYIKEHNTQQAKRLLKKTTYNHLAGIMLLLSELLHIYRKLAYGMKKSGFSYYKYHKILMSWKNEFFDKDKS